MLYKYLDKSDLWCFMYDQIFYQRHPKQVCKGSKTHGNLLFGCSIRLLTYGLFELKLVAAVKTRYKEIHVECNEEIIFC